MTDSSRKIGLVLGLLAMGWAGAACAQENLDLGKTPAQLYAADCAICHKSPNGLSKAGGILGLDSFLREHYTASRESAAAIAAYLKTIDTGAPAPQQRATKSKKKSKEAEKKQAKPEEAKTEEKKSDEKKTEEKKADEKKASEKKKAEEKKSATKKSDKGKTGKSKASATENAEKPAEAQSDQTKPAEKKAAVKKKATAKKPAEEEKKTD